MRFSSLLPLLALLVGCAEPGPSAAEGGGLPAEPPENRPPMLSGAPPTLTEGETRSLGPIFDPDGDPVALQIRDVTPGLTVERVNDELQLSLAYGVAVEDGVPVEDAVVRATLELDDGRGGRVVQELIVYVAPLAWREVASWMAANGPPPRRGGVVLSHGGALYELFGEVGGQPATDAWRFDPSDATWSPVALVGDVPPPGTGKRVVTDHGLLVHGGFGPDGGPLDDLHRVTVESAAVLVFERIEQEGAPPPRAEHLLVAGGSISGDGPAEPDLVVFGGVGGTRDTPEVLDDLWTMELVDGRARWSIATREERPEARLGMAVAHDRDEGRVVLFGGRAEPSGPPLDGTWSLDLRAPGGPRFAPIEVEGPPSPRAGASAAWDPVGHRAFLVGGADETGAVRDDVFVLDERGEAAAWIAIEREGAPSMGEGAIALERSWTPSEGRRPRPRLWVGLGVGASSLHALEPTVGGGYGRGW